MPGPWWEWAITLLLSGTLCVVLAAAVWILRDDLRALPDRLTGWLEDVAARLEPQPPECSCRTGGQPVAIRSWELGDSLGTGATGPVIDHRCPTCWLPRQPLPRPPSGPGGGSHHTYSDGPMTVAKDSRALTLAETRACAIGDHDMVTIRNLGGDVMIERCSRCGSRTPLPPVTGGVRFGGDRQATYWLDANNPSPIRAYVARLSDGTTRTFATEEELKAWILSTAPRESQPH